MRKWHFVQFFKASGRIGGGSVIFGLLLFGFAIWEHYWNRNIPTAVLVSCGVFFFCYGCYLAWLKELQEKEKIIASQEVPAVELTLDSWQYQYDADKNLTVFFMAASVLNKGHQTNLINWKIRYEFGPDIEIPEMPHLTDSYCLTIGTHKIQFTNDDLLTVKCRERVIGKGMLMDGRILFTLPDDRRSQCHSGLVKVTVSCFDFMGQESTRLFVPSTILQKTIVKGAREKTTSIKADQ